MSDLIPGTDAETYDFLYLDRDEAIFLMGLVKGQDCTTCPRFYRGCKGNYTRSESLSMAPDRWLTEHREGTEGHLCHKLRTLINLRDAELIRVKESYQDYERDRLAVLLRKNDAVALTTRKDSQEKTEVRKAAEVLKKAWEDRLAATEAKYEARIQKLMSEVETLRSTMVLKEEQIRFYERVLTEKGGA